MKDMDEVLAQDQSSRAAGAGFEEDRLGMIEAFMAVAQNMSFIKAAERMSKTPSAMSRKVHRLEKTLGVRLLNRTTRRVSLTEAGELYFSSSRELLQGLAEADSLVMSLNATPRGLLRVSAPEAFGRLHIVRAIAGFMKANSGIKVDLNLSDAYVDLVADQYDVAIRIGVLPESRLISRRLASNQRLLVASPDYVARHGLPRSPADLAGHKCLIFSRYPHFGAQWSFESGERYETVTVEGPLRTDSSTAAFEAAEHGLGIGLVARYLCNDALVAGRLVRLLPEWSATPEAGIHVVFSTKKHLPLKTRVFVDFLIDHFRDAPWNVA